MTSLHATFLAIQDRSQKTANVQPYVLSWTPSVPSFRDIWLRLLAQAAEPSRRPHPLFLLSLSLLADRGWLAVTSAHQDHRVPPSNDAQVPICPSCRGGSQVEQPRALSTHQASSNVHLLPSSLRISNKFILRKINKMFLNFI